MDKVRPVLEWMRKNHFWVACGVITAMILLAWFLATGNLRTDIADRVTKIEGGFGSANRIMQTPNHPNPASHKVVEDEIGAKRDEVAAAWRLQFDRQQSVFVWPEELPDDLKQEAQALFPIEAKVGTATDKEIDRLKRDVYRTFIQRHLPKLADIVRAEWTPGAADAKDKDKDRSKYIVDWMTPDQKKLAQERFGWGDVPSTVDMLYAQEDLWVTRQILEIIRQTNGDVEARYKAPIKTIKSISLGKEVGKIEEAGGIALGGMAKVSSGDSGMQAGAAGKGEFSVEKAQDMLGGMLKQMGVGDSKGGSGGGSTKAADPWDNRYVDESFAGVEANKVRNALRSKTATDAQLVVAKRLPVRLELLIDQRKINRFIALCGNAQLPLEIRQVRINRSGGFDSSGIGGEGGPSSGGPGGMGGGGGGGIDMSAMAESLAAGGPGGGGGAGGAAGGLGKAGKGAKAAKAVKALPKDQSPFDVPIEVLGIVYIYNPVDMEKLGNSLDKPDAKAKPGTTTPGSDTKGTPAGAGANASGAQPQQPAPAADAGKTDAEKKAGAPGSGDGKQAAAADQPAG